MYRLIREKENNKCKTQSYTYIHTYIHIYIYCAVLYRRIVSTSTKNLNL
ncbi:MAG: hypothetical protein NW900_01995 [Candidatus Blochmannia sp. A2]|nr:hypothetical protein [Candidatus Blochmannia sp. A2]